MEGNKNQSNYGISKYFGEMEVWRGMGEGLTSLIVNPATLLGYGDWNESSLVCLKRRTRNFPGIWKDERLCGYRDSGLRSLPYG